MTDDTVMSDAKARAWISEFQNEPPLHTLFPLTLSNGKTVPSIHVVCSCCDGRLSGDRIHGRVVQSLAHVVTVAANGYCEQCERMTHIDCRFRTIRDETVVEWLASNGRWQARQLRQPTVVEKITRGAHRLLEWLGRAL